MPLSEIQTQIGTRRGEHLQKVQDLEASKQALEEEVCRLLKKSKKERQDLEAEVYHLQEVLRVNNLNPVGIRTLSGPAC